MNRFGLSVAALLFIPTAAAAEESPICTDRPGKGNAVCTVPPGTWQVESQAVDWIQLSNNGSDAKIWVLGATVVKLGLSDRSDLQLGVAPWIHSTVKAAGSNTTTSGFGDLVVRYKYRLTNDGAPAQFALIPFVKLPTASHDIGNRKVEGGLAAPIGIATGDAIAITLGPELDLLADSDGAGHHVQLVNLINVSGSLAPHLTLGGEIWTATNFDAADTTTQLSADAAIAYAITKDLQLDGGANFGLNSNTADIELYAGISFRF